MALSPTLQVIRNSVEESERRMREIAADMRGAVSSSHVTLTEARKAIAQANELLGQRNYKS